MRDIGSVWRGIKAIKRPYKEPKPKWAIKMQPFALGFWAHYWAPIWHQGRGPYVSIGLGIVAVYRGY
jgi:hypothetical protein